MKTNKNSLFPSFSYNAILSLVVTLGLVGLFRLGNVLTVPGISPSYISMVNSSNLLSLIGLSTVGAGLNNYTLFALGVAPFVTASIIVQLLGLVNPVKRWRDQGLPGRKKQNNLLKFIALLASVYQGYLAFGPTAFMFTIDGESPVTSTQSGAKLIFFIAIAVIGTFMLSFIGDAITRLGLGNGQSVIIASGILASLSTMPSSFASVGKKASFILIVSVVLTALLVILFNHLTVKIPIISSEEGGKKVYFPIKLNPVGMIPVIFASMTMAIPNMVNRFANIKAFDKVSVFLSLSEWSGIVVYAILILLFSIVYVTIQFNPKEMAERLNHSYQVIEGVAPGKETINFFKSILNRLGFMSGLVLAGLAILPLLITTLLKIPTAEIGLLGTSMIILVTTLSDVAARYNGVSAEERFIDQLEGV